MKEIFDCIMQQQCIIIIIIPEDIFTLSAMRTEILPFISLFCMKSAWFHAEAFE
jgi:hypothetical protein